jgi:hypothetical protein
LNEASYDLEEFDEPEKNMFRKMLDLLRPFFAGLGLLPFDLMLPIDDAGDNLPKDGS